MHHNVSTDENKHLLNCILLPENLNEYFLLYNMMWYLLYIPEAEVDISLYYIRITCVFTFQINRGISYWKPDTSGAFSFAQRDILAITIAPMPQFINGRRWILSKVIHRSIRISCRFSNFIFYLNVQDGLINELGKHAVHSSCEAIEKRALCLVVIIHWYGSYIDPFIHWYGRFSLATWQWTTYTGYQLLRLRKCKMSAPLVSIVALLGLRVDFWQYRDYCGNHCETLLSKTLMIRYLFWHFILDGTCTKRFFSINSTTRSHQTLFHFDTGEGLRLSRYGIFIIYYRSVLWKQLISQNILNCAFSCSRNTDMFSIMYIQYIPRNMHTVLLCFALLWLCNRS